MNKSGTVLVSNSREIGGGIIKSATKMTKPVKERYVINNHNYRKFIKIILI